MQNTVMLPSFAKHIQQVSMQKCINLISEVKLGYFPILLFSNFCLMDELSIKICIYIALHASFDVH